MSTQIYTRFASFLQTGLYSSYEQICRALHVAPDDLDELLLSNLGYTGDQLFLIFGNEQEIH
jgi:hypothetical protein